MLRDEARRTRGLTIRFGGLTALYWVIARFWPSIPGQKVFRKGFRTDCIYWLWTPIVSKGVTAVAIGVVLYPLVYFLGLHYATLVQGHGILSRQPLWLQGIEVFVIGDFLGYWQHRWFHGASTQCIIRRKNSTGCRRYACIR